MAEKNAPDYCPTLDEISSRGEALRWMLIMEWPMYLIDSIFYDDSPSLETARDLVYRFGPDEAKRRMILML